MNGFTGAEILVLGDSLAFGRVKYGIKKHHTWPYLLEKSLGSRVVIRSTPGSSYEDIVHEAQALHKYYYSSTATNNDEKYHAIIIQCGIVDITPRLLPRCLCTVKPFSLLLSLKRNKYVYQIIGKPWYSINQIQENAARALNILSSMSDIIILVAVPNPSGHLVENIGDFTHECTALNKALSSNLQGKIFLHPWGQQTTEDYLLPDGFHLNLIGHKRLADALLTTLQSLN